MNDVETVADSKRRFPDTLGSSDIAEISNDSSVTASAVDECTADSVDDARRKRMRCDPVDGASTNDTALSTAAGAVTNMSCSVAAAHGQHINTPSGQEVPVSASASSSVGDDRRR